MNTLGVWSTIAIFYQTFLCVIISWLTLSCKLGPNSSELHEVTLVKLLYLYEPEACGQIIFYNYTTTDAADGVGTSVVWPVKNDIAAAFRRKVQLWLVLHLLWSMLAIVNLSQASRACGFYVTLLPFTITGFTILTVDVVFCALFISDASRTDTETAILDYINSDKGHLHSINSTLHRSDDAADTSWVSVTFAYCSLRGIVQWILNFWIVKDSYFNGVTRFHHLQQESKDKMESKISLAHIHV